MANNSIALGVEVPNFGNSFAQGAESAQGRQINSMKMDMAQREQGREEAMQLMQMLGSAGMYALNGDMNGTPDAAKWDEAMDGLSQFGLDSAKYKGKPQLASVLVNASLSAADQIKMARDDQQFALTLQKLDQDLAQHAESMDLRRQGLDLQRERLEGGGKAPSGYRKTEQGDLEFIPGGPADPKSISTRSRPLTEGQAKTAGYAKRMVEAEGILSVPPEGGKAIIDEADPGRASLNPLSGDFWSAMNRKYGPNMTQSPEYQKFLNGAQEWVRAKLRKESGAAISQSEWESEFSTYFPQPGDKPETVAQKAALRATAVESMKAESRGGFKALFEDSGGVSAIEGEKTLEDMTDADLEALSDAELEALINGE